VAAIPLDVLPFKTCDLGGSDAGESTDGDERQDAGVGGEQETFHFLRSENLDLGFRLLERFGLLGSGLAVGMQVSLLFGEHEQGDDVAADAILADWTELLESVEEPVDVGHRDVCDVSRNGIREPLQAGRRIPDIDVAYAFPLERHGEFSGSLDVAASGEKVSTVCGVEPDGIRERDATSGAPCARPFLDGDC